MIRIYTYANNRTDFLPYQKRTFEAFLEDTHELVVVNNGDSDELTREIERVSLDLGLEQRVVDPRDRRNPSIAHAHAINWSRQVMATDDDISVIIDADIFAIARFSIRRYLDGYQMAGHQQARGKVHYLWPGVIFLNWKLLPGRDEIDYWCGRVNGEPVDVGGQLYHYLEKHGIRLRCIPHAHLSADRMQELVPEQLQAAYDPHFRLEYLGTPWLLHYGGGSDWDNQGTDYHHRKTAFVFRLLDGLLEGSLKLPPVVLREPPPVPSDVFRHAPDTEDFDMREGGQSRG